MNALNGDVLEGNTLPQQPGKTVLQSVGEAEVDSPRPSSNVTTQADSTYSRMCSRGSDMTDAIDAQSRREITRISTELSKMRMECMKEVVAKDESERRFATASKNLQQERQRVRELEEKLRKVETERLCAQARESSLLEENEKMRAEVIDMKVELSGMTKERDDAEERCRSVEGLLEEAWQKMKTIAACEDASSKRAEKSNHQVMNLRENVVELERKMSLLNGDLKASFALTDTLQKEVVALKMSEKKMEAKLASAVEEVDIYACSAKALEAQVDCMHGDIQQYQDQITDLTTRMDSWKNMLSSQKSEICALQQRLAQSEDACKTLRDERADIDREHEKQRVAMEHQFVALTNEATRECERLHGIIANVQTQKEAIQSDLTSEMSRACKLGKSLDKQVLLTENLQGELAALQEVERDLVERLDAKQRECDGLNADLLKHKELISYINKLSTEAEAKRNSK